MRGRRWLRRLRGDGWPLFCAFASAIAVLPGAARSGPASPVAVEELATVVVAALPPAPLFLGLAQVVVPPGVRTEAAGSVGPRLLAVESGLLTVAAEGPGAAVRAAGGGGWGGPEPVVAGAGIVLGPGDRLVLESGAVREVRNDGARSAVYLDAALMPAGDAPGDAAFTTEGGVSFQLLAGDVLADVPPAPVAFSLSRLRLPPGGALPPDARLGPAIAYVEAGLLEVVATAGAASFSRAASPAPLSAAGPMRPIVPGRAVTVTAGASLALMGGSEVAASNGREVPATLLLVEVRPHPTGAAAVAGTPPGAA